MSDFSEKIPVGISQCLLGENVRYDGSHKRSSVCADLLARCFEFIPICPEMGIGMGAPREAIHLQDSPHDAVLRAVGNKTAGLDVTEKLEHYARQKAQELGHLCGYIFMDRSPSCGLGSSKVYHENGNLSGKRASGIFAREFTQQHPLLPVEEEGRLHDENLCENFVARVYSYKRWQDLVKSGLNHAGLQDFHARHKYLLMSHRNESYRHLGRLVALAHQRPLEIIAHEYIHEFMATLKIVSSTKTHANVLQHLMGYLKRDLDAASKQELLALINAYRSGRISLLAPLTLLKQQLQKHPNSYLQQQVYLEPHPPGLMLRHFH